MRDKDSEIILNKQIYVAKSVLLCAKKMFCPQDASFRASNKTPSRHREEVLRVLIYWQDFRPINAQRYYRSHSGRKRNSIYFLV